MQQVIDGSIASKPPMGWNSWDCFGVNVTEEEVMQNALFMAKNLKQYGWEYVVVDLGWYAPEATKDNYKDPKIPFLVDEFGRLIPDPVRFPSSAGGKGFKPLADFIHSLGLKFGIHIMRGMPWNASDEKLPVKGSDTTADQVSNPEDMCLWYKSMYGIDMTKKGALEYYHSIMELYVSWEVDFIKADDMNSFDGDGMYSHYRTDEVEAISHAIANCGRPMVLSLSPGAAYIGNANHLRRNSHMWRISCDFWDDWAALKRQFERCERWAPRIAEGHWPDADMLPFGGVGIRGEIGEPRQTNFNENELHTLMTLWCIFRSPLMYGGHLPESDALAIKMISNEEVLAVNQHSMNNRLLFREGDKIVWTANCPEGECVYLALFNHAEVGTVISVDLSLLGLDNVSLRDLWQKKDLGTIEAEIRLDVAPHGARFLKLS